MRLSQRDSDYGLDGRVGRVGRVGIVARKILEITAETFPKISRFSQKIFGVLVKFSICNPILSHHQVIDQGQSTHRNKWKVLDGMNTSGIFFASFFDANLNSNSLPHLSFF
jgi:hypothetical protein